MRERDTAAFQKAQRSKQGSPRPVGADGECCQDGRGGEEGRIETGGDARPRNKPNPRSSPRRRNKEGTARGQQEHAADVLHARKEKDVNHATGYRDSLAR
jgi:hypothetical protein